MYVYLFITESHYLSMLFHINNEYFLFHNSCIHPITTITSVFSGESNLFYGALDHKSEIRTNKKLYHPSSDHIAMAWIYKQWFQHNTNNKHLIPRFCKQMRIRQNRMEVLNRK